MSRFHFDFTTAVLTILAAPLAYFLLSRIAGPFRKWVQYFADSTLLVLSRTLRSSLAARISLRRYVLIQLNSFSYRLYVPTSSGITMEIDRMYVPLRLRQAGSVSRIFSHRNLFQAGTRIQIIGDPGSGKSTLIKKIMRDTCGAALHNPTRSRLPIIVELKELVPPKDYSTYEELTEWALTELRRRVTLVDGYQMEEFFDIYSKDTGLLVLLDGLDEVSGYEYDRTATAIAGLSRRLQQLSENSVVVITMNTQFHVANSKSLAIDFPVILHLQPFTPTDAYSLIERWPFADNREQRVTRIYSNLIDKPSLREMCSNPLVLSMYVASQSIGDSNKIPSTRTEFYSQVVKELLVDRQARQLSIGASRLALREQRETILGHLAFMHFIDPNQPVNSLSWDSALEVVSDVLGCDEHEAAAYFRQLAATTGLITEERYSESFRFIHLTFCEFFAAMEAAQGGPDGWNELIAAHERFRKSGAPHLTSRLLEVISFASALLPRRKREAAVRAVADLNDQQLLAESLLETQGYDYQSWHRWISNEIHYFMTSVESQWDEGWLRRLYLFNVVLSDAERSGLFASEARAAATVEEMLKSLIAHNHDRLVHLFATYAAEDPIAAFRLAEACQVDLMGTRPDLIVESCVERPVLALACTRSTEEIERIELWAAILAEAGLRYRFAAIALTDFQSPEEGRSITQEFPRGHRWLGLGGVKSTFYGDCLTLACTQNQTLDRAETFPRVAILKNVKPSGSALSPWKRFRDLVLALGLFVLSMIITSWSVTRGLPTKASIGELVEHLFNWGTILGLFASGVLFSAVVAILRFSKDGRTIYDCLTNVTSPAGRHRPRSRQTRKLDETLEAEPAEMAKLSPLSRFRYRSAMLAWKQMVELAESPTHTPGATSKRARKASAEYVVDHG